MTAVIEQNNTFSLGHQTVNHKTAVNMVRKQVVATGNKRIYNHFTKAELLEMLNQPGAEGINFYFGHNEEGKNTLIAVGANEDQSNLKVINALGNLVTSDKLMIGGGVMDCKL